MPGVDVRQVIREELTKALALPAGATATPVSPAYLAQLGLNRGYGNPSAALTRDPNNSLPFGPGEPLYPAPIAPPLASGRPAPQRWDYPQSWNLQTTTTRMVPWSILRDSADRVSVMRSCIETCKSALTGLDWSFTIDSARARALAKRANTSSHAVIADLQDEYADDIDRLHQWWQKPDKISNWNFCEWLTALLEDELVLDAISVYPHLTMGGELLAAEIIDSTMIKPLLDYRGATPQPPYAAYQQIRMGFPRGEYSQFGPEKVDHQFISAVYGPTVGVHAATDVLIYKVRNRRSRGPYGFSCVEQALSDVDLWLKRWNWLRSEYTDGVIPEMVVKVDASMTPEQMREWQSILNDALSGNTAERHRATFLPQGFDAQYPQNMNAKFASDLDLHLIRLMCASFDVLPTSLGFTPTSRMGSSGSSRGMQQGEQDSQLQRGTKPRAKWVVDLINEISTNYLGKPPEVTFTFHGLDDQDEQKTATLMESYVNTGLMVLNEGRDQLNLPRYSFPEANEPFLNTPTGPAWLNVEVQPVGMPGNLPSAAQNQPGFTTAPPPENRDEQVQDNPDDPSNARTPDTDKVARKKEQKAFVSFADRRAGTRTWRDFEFTHVDKVTALAANRLAAAGSLDVVKALFAQAP